MEISRAKTLLPSHFWTIMCSSIINWFETTTIANDLAVAKQLDHH